MALRSASSSLRLIKNYTTLKRCGAFVVKGAKFETYQKLHYSQTAGIPDHELKVFETYQKLHYSQTFKPSSLHTCMFETYQKLHYSQTLCRRIVALI